MCALDVNAERGLLVSGSYDHALKLWDLNKGGAAVATLGEHTGPVIACRFDRAGRTVRPTTRVCGALAHLSTQLVSSSRDTSLKVWDVKKRPKCALTLKEHVDWCVVCSPLLGRAFGVLIATRRACVCRVKCLQFDAKRVVSGSYDGTIKVWDMKSGKCTRTLRGHSGAINALQVRRCGLRRDVPPPRDAAGAV